jgi:hypothetical protein
MCYAFRFVDENNKPTGYYGIGFARTLNEMFWQIDEHGDPYAVEIKAVTEASICFKADTQQISNEESEINFSELEISESISFLPEEIDCGFKKVSWPTFEERHKHLMSR